jgi:hypothetical protein
MARREIYRVVHSYPKYGGTDHMGSIRYASRPTRRAAVDYPGPGSPTPRLPRSANPNA